MDTRTVIASCNSSMNISSLLEQANQCIQTGQLNAAAEIYKQLLIELPDAPDLHHTLGLVYLELEELDQAISHIQQSILLSPNHAKAHRSLGDAYSKAGRTDASLAAYHKASALNPEDPETLINLGNILQKMNRFHEAFDTYRKVLDLSPDNIKALNNMGKTCQDMGNLDQAMQYYDCCVQIDPNYAEARFNRSTALLAQGDFRNGWIEYEWRFQRKNADQIYPHKLTTPRWMGESYRGQRLLVHCEQGLGDTLQFVRYLPLVKQRGGTLILEIQPPLLTLLNEMPCVDEVVAFDPQQPPTIFHHRHIPLLSLPGLFNIAEENLANHIPYLYSDAEYQRKYPNKIVTEELKIGLVWAGSNIDPKRSCPLDHFQPLFQLPGILFYSLQEGAGEEQRQRHPEIHPVTDLGCQLNGFKNTADAVANLDLIITIDTAMAHLAGAMGKPVWVILPFSADWRWPYNQTNTPWYPTARVFRQLRMDDWQSVISQIGQALSQWRQEQNRKHHKLSSNDHYRGLRMKTPENRTKSFGQASSESSLRDQRLSTPIRNSKIKNVLLVSPIYGGSYEVIRYLQAGFSQAGINTIFQDNSSAYPVYQEIEQGPYDKNSKEHLVNRLISTIDQQLMASVERHKPDLVMAVAQSPIHDETVTQLRAKGIACAYWFVEDYRFRTYWAQKAPLFDYFFTIQRGDDLKQQFITMGLSNWHYLPLACDPTIHKPWQASSKEKEPYRCQIGFMGAPYINRLKMFETLTQWDLGIWGEGWNDHALPSHLKRCVKQGKERISVADSVKIYCCSDIVVNLHSSPFCEGICTDGDFVNPRTFEVAGCSGFQLCDSRTELPEHFTPGKEIILFNSKSELIELAPYWLDRPDLRKEIALKAQKRAYGEHTYRHRAQEIVRIIEN